MLDTDQKRLLEISNGLHYNNVRLQRSKQGGNVDINDHIQTVGKVTVGGVAGTGTLWSVIANMPLDHAIQIATLASACFAGLYYFVATVLAIRSRNDGSSK